LNTVVARTRLFNLHPRVAINLHCIPTLVLSRCSQNLSNGLRNKCKVTLSWLHGLRGG